MPLRIEDLVEEEKKQEKGQAAFGERPKSLLDAGELPLRFQAPLPESPLKPTQTMVEDYKQEQRERIEKFGVLQDAPSVGVVGKIVNDYRDFRRGGFGRPAAVTHATSEAGKSLLWYIVDYLQRGQYVSINLLRTQMGTYKEGVWSAIWKGALGKEKGTYQDVLKDLGVENPWAIGLGGFVGDVVLDPTTYLGAGFTAIGDAKRAYDVANKALDVADKIGDVKAAARAVDKIADATKTLKKAGINPLDPDAIKLGANLSERIARGEMAILKFAGKPFVRGGKIINASGKITTAIKKTRVGATIKRMFSTKLDIPELEILRRKALDGESAITQTLFKDVNELLETHKIPPEQIAEVFEKIELRKFAGDTPLDFAARDVDELLSKFKSYSRTGGIGIPDLYEYPEMLEKAEIRKLSKWYEKKLEQKIEKYTRQKEITLKIREIKGVGREAIKDARKISKKSIDEASQFARDKAIINEFVKTRKSTTAQLDDVERAIKGLYPDYYNEIISYRMFNGKRDFAYEVLLRHNMRKVLAGEEEMLGALGEIKKADIGKIPMPDFRVKIDLPTEALESIKEKAIASITNTKTWKKEVERINRFRQAKEVAKSRGYMTGILSEEARLAEAKGAFKPTRFRVYSDVDVMAQKGKRWRTADGLPLTHKEVEGIWSQTLLEKTPEELEKFGIERIGDTFFRKQNMWDRTTGKAREAAMYYSYDLSKILGIRARVTGKTIVGKWFLDNVAYKFGKDLPPEVADEVLRIHSILTNDKEIQGLLGVYDEALNVWKGYTLAVPEYHVRNFFSNIWQNYVAGVKDPRVYVEGEMILRGMDGTFLTEMGERYSYGEIRRLAHNHRVTGGFFGIEVVPTKSKSVLAQVGTALPKASRKVGTEVEDLGRVAHFIDRLNKGDNPFEASMSVKKYLFDYNDLTDLEKTVMKRIMPFYTWTRKNIPLQLEQMIKQPGKYAGIGKFKTMVEDKPRPEDRFIPDWLRESTPIKIGGKWIPLEAVLPAADIGKLQHPLEEAYWMLTPAIKTPVELFFNRDPMKKRDIESGGVEYERFLGVAMRRRISTIFKNVRQLGKIDRVMKSIKEGEELGDIIVRELAALRPYEIDTDKEAYREYRRLTNQYNDMMYKAKSAYMKGDIDIAEKYEEKMQETLEEMEERFSE